MAESCTFVPSPFKPSHCKLCFQPKVEHKIPVIKPESKPVQTPVNATTSPKENNSSTVETKPIKSFKYQSQDYQPPKQVEPKPVETKPAKVYKYQLSQSNPHPTTPVQEVKPVETKPAKVYKYQLKDSSELNASAKFAMTETLEVTENQNKSSNSHQSGTENEEIKPRKVFVPKGAVKMQGFDPRILAGEAQKRRAKKNLEDGALEEAHGLAAEPEKKPEELWEPIPTTATRIGPGLGMIGGSGLTAALQKRKEKEAAAEALSNPNGVASKETEEVVVEEVSVLPPRMKEVLARIEQVPHELPPDTPPIETIPTYIPTDIPTDIPIDNPYFSTDFSTDIPTDIPTDNPTDNPTETIHTEPTYTPTYAPTYEPEGTQEGGGDGDGDDDNDDDDDEEWS